MQYVYAQLKAQFPNLIGWHCLNHRLELSVHDATEACTEMNHFLLFHPETIHTV